jgi:predicted Co/Zn/Cd cation transporter (cation efflux family)
MSLRAFHLVFISLSVVLAAFVAAWAAQQYQAAHAATYALTAVGALASGVVMAIYGAMFQKKTRRLS